MGCSCQLLHLAHLLPYEAGCRLTGNGPRQKLSRKIGMMQLQKRHVTKSWKFLRGSTSVALTSLNWAVVVRESSIDITHARGSRFQFRLAVLIQPASGRWAHLVYSNVFARATSSRVVWTRRASTSDNAPPRPSVPSSATQN